MEIARRALNNNPDVLRRLQQINCNSTLIAAISKLSCQKGELILRSNELSKHPRGDDGFPLPCCSKGDALSPTCKSPAIQFGYVFADDVGRLVVGVAQKRCA